jgi:hypothetical protein
MLQNGRNAQIGASSFIMLIYVYCRLKGPLFEIKKLSKVARR